MSKLKSLARCSATALLVSTINLWCSGPRPDVPGALDFLSAMMTSYTSSYVNGLGSGELDAYSATTVGTYVAGASGNLSLKTCFATSGSVNIFGSVLLM